MNQFVRDHIPGDAIQNIVKSGILDIVDVISFSFVSKSVYLQLHEQESYSGVWSWLIARDFMPENIVIEGITPRELYIKYYRSKISLLGLCRPGDVLKYDDVYSSVKNALSIKPFWIMHFYHTHNRTGNMAIYDKVDVDSYFGTVLYINEAQKIDIQGTVIVPLPGYYRVNWGVNFGTHFDVGALNFRTKVFNGDKKKERNFDPIFGEDERREAMENEIGDFMDESILEEDNPVFISDGRHDLYFHSHYWNAGNAGQGGIQTDVWLTHTTGYICIDEPKTTVFFSCTQDSMDWKYHMSIDYIELEPCLPSDIP